MIKILLDTILQIMQMGPEKQQKIARKQEYKSIPFVLLRFVSPTLSKRSNYVLTAMDDLKGGGVG